MPPLVAVGQPDGVRQAVYVRWSTVNNKFNEADVSFEGLANAAFDRFSAVYALGRF